MTGMLGVLLSGPVAMSRETKRAVRRVQGPRTEEDLITEYPSSVSRVVAALTELKQSQHGAFAVSIHQLSDLAKLGHSSVGESLLWLLRAGVVIALDVSGRAINPEERKGKHVRWMLKDFMSELLKSPGVRPEVRAVLREACAIRIAEQGSGRRAAGDNRKDAGSTVEGGGAGGAGDIAADVSELAGEMMRVGKRMQAERPGTEVAIHGRELERAGFIAMTWADAMEACKPCV